VWEALYEVCQAVLEVQYRQGLTLELNFLHLIGAWSQANAIVQCLLAAVRPLRFLLKADPLKLAMALTNARAKYAAGSRSYDPTKVWRLSVVKRLQELAFQCSSLKIASKSALDDELGNSLTSYLSWTLRHLIPRTVLRT
jgi:hypothetical protein